MKRLLANILLVVVGLTASSQLLALGLGELTLQSALNQPLQAEIELVDAKGLSEWEIKPALASQSDFDRAGVDRIFFLTGITFKVDGSRIVLTTREPVNEPFLNFLVELNWPAGRVLREYTVLLDPPVFQEESYQPLVSAPAAASSQSSVPASESVVPAQPVPVAVNRWDAEPAPAGSYKVQQNDTLWDIALQTRPSAAITPQQMMIALQQENPAAFIGGNINRLKSHQVLRIPDEQRVREISLGRAVAEVARQNQVLKAGVAQVDATGRGGEPVAGRPAKQGGEVRLLSAGSEESDSAGAAGEVADGAGSGRQQALENDLAIALENVDKGRRENEELRKRLESLEEQINTLQRLISLKDDQLAGMQVSGEEQVATEASAAAVSESVVEQAAPVDFNYQESPDSAATEAASDDVASAESAENAASAQESESAADVQAREEAEAQARRDRIAALLAEQEKEQRPQPGLVDELLANPVVPAAAVLVLLLIALLVVRAIKARKSAAPQESEQEEIAVSDDMPVDTSSLDDFDFDEDDLKSHHAADDKRDELSHQEDHFETVAQTEDAISESDIYIAYGKFEQAIDLLQGAIESEPSRTDLRLKLLEVYVEMDDANGFASAEAELASLGDRAAIDEAKHMRQRLSSPVAPVAAAGAVGVAAAGALSLDDEIPELDSALGDEFADGLDFGEALDMSESAADVAVLKDSGSADDVPVLDLDDGLDFDISVDETPEAEPVAQSSYAQSADDSLDFDLGDFDAPLVTESSQTASVEQDDDALSFDLDSLDDGSLMSESPVAAPESSEVALDDSLDFDLDSLSTEPEERVADVSSESDIAIDSALEFSAEDDVSVAVDDGLDSLESLLDGDASGSDELPDLSFDMEEDTGFAEASEDDLRSLDSELGSDASLDDELQQLAEVDDTDVSGDDGFVPDLTDSVSEVPVQSGEIDLDQLAAADDEFDFLAGTDECATKLDLARAYIDMEDFDGARELLQEVMQEGSDQQKTDARSLLSNMA